MLSNFFSIIFSRLCLISTWVILQEEEIPDLEKKLQSIFKVIANHSVEPSKAEEFLQKLHQMKNESVFVALSTILNPCTTVTNAATARVCHLELRIFPECNFRFFEFKIWSHYPSFNYLTFPNLTSCIFIFNLFIQCCLVTWVCFWLY